MREAADGWCRDEDVPPQQCGPMKVWEVTRGECVCDPPAFDNGTGGCTIGNQQCEHDKYWHNSDLGCICREQTVGINGRCEIEPMPTPRPQCDGNMYWHSSDY